VAIRCPPNTLENFSQYFNNYRSNNRVDIRSVCSSLTYSNLPWISWNLLQIFLLLFIIIIIKKNSTQSPNWQEQEVQTRKKNNLRVHLINK
jgi:hypothetical protein